VKDRLPAAAQHSPACFPGSWSVLASKASSNGHHSLRMLHRIVCSEIVCRAIA